MPLTLCVYDPAEDFDAYPPNSMISIEEYLHSAPAWRADLYEIVVLFDELPMRIVDDMNTFGVLHNILPQLEEIRSRLLEGKFALLRTVGEHTAIFFIFRPIGNKVFFSTYQKFPFEYLSYFPLQDSPMFYPDGRNQQKLLYDFVEGETEEGYPENTAFVALADIRDIEMDLNALVESLEMQISLGYELVANEKTRIL